MTYVTCLIFTCIANLKTDRPVLIEVLTYFGFDREVGLVVCIRVSLG